MKNVNQYEPTGNYVKDWESAGFTPRKISKAARIIEEMIQDSDCKVFMSVAGALIPAGMRKVLVEFLKNKWVDALIVTGATLTHDLFEALGEKHYLGSEKADDKKLREKGIDRIWDVYLKNESYEVLDDFCKQVFSELENKEYSSKELVWEIGKMLSDDDSLIRQSYLQKIPVYCPALVDSGLGMQVWSNKISVDPYKDWDELVVNQVWNAKKTGVIILGGGVPKNFILQAQQFSDKEHGYAVQITTAPMHDGGLSGAELKEAVSWGKLGKESKKEDVRADVTIVLPVIVDYLKKKKVKR